jgi:hypothetical protein
VTVVLNQPALHFLLESQSGPVGIDLRRRAEQVTRLAEQNASGPIIGIETGDLHSGIKFTISADGEGLFASIGTAAKHRGFAYPAYWDQTGRPWLTTALRDGFR